MNIDKLYQGQIIKNYKELCLLLGISQSTGNSKLSQLKEIERFCAYHKEGNKFIIDEIYEIPLPKVDGRGSTSIYEEDIQSLIIHECSISKMEAYNSIKLSCSSLANKLKIINNNYMVGRNSINKFSDYLNVPVETIYDFYDSTQRKNKSIIENALNKLKDKALIRWTTETMVCTNENNYRIATDRDILAITEIEQEVLNILGEESKKDVFIKRKWNEFQKQIHKLLYEYETGFTYYFDVYKIIATEKFKIMMLNQESYSEITKRLNDNICKSEINSSVRRHDKSIEYLNKHDYGYLVGENIYHDGYKKLNDNGYKFKSDKAKASNEYIDDTKKIIDICINKNNEVNLDFELKIKRENIITTNNEIPF